MSIKFVSKPLVAAVACAFALGFASTGAVAQTANETALLLDSRGAPVMNSSGQCWHTSFGPMPAWTAGCHPAPVARYVAPTPAPVAQAATPTPAPAAAAVVAAAPPPATYEKVVFDANVLFDSGKSTLLPAGRQTLDQFADKIHGLDSQSVVAVGYADRMGTTADNQRLSQDRVDAVKAYMVGKGIAPDRMQTSAKGETQPSTALADCKDANNVKNVACMQPDRHVFIEVSGTRVAKQ